MTQLSIIYVSLLRMFSKKGAAMPRLSCENILSEQYCVATLRACFNAVMQHSHPYP